jgi:hypothetical protein
MTVLAAIVIATGGVGYLVNRGADPDAAAAADPGAAGAAAAARGSTATAAPPTHGATPPRVKAAPRTRPGAALAPVVTDRVPAPRTSIALSASVPGTTNMQQSAATAFETALAAARRAGEQPDIRSAWRSAQWQQILFDRAVTTYGSRTQARRWVLPPDESAHVKGYAVDVSPLSAARWLEAHGSAYGLCRTYDNEWWHFEYLATTSCPPPKPTAGS